MNLYFFSELQCYRKEDDDIKKAELVEIHKNNGYTIIEPSKELLQLENMKIYFFDDFDSVKIDSKGNHKLRFFVDIHKIKDVKDFERLKCLINKQMWYIDHYRLCEEISSDNTNIKLCFIAIETPEGFIYKKVYRISTIIIPDHYIE